MRIFYYFSFLFLMFSTLYLYNQIDFTYINGESCDKMINILFGVIEKVISGIILIYIGLSLFKKQKRFQILKEKEIEYEIKLFYFKRIFRKFFNKFGTEMRIDSFSTSAEDKMYFFYQQIEDIIKFREYYNIKNNDDLHVISNFLYYKIIILNFNNNREKFYNDINLLSEESFNINQKLNIKINSDKAKEGYFKSYQKYKSKVDVLLSNNII